MASETRISPGYFDAPVSLDEGSHALLFKNPNLLYEALCKKAFIALLEPKFPRIPAEVIPTIVEFWAHPGDYCMTFGPATLVRRGLEEIAARVATMNLASNK